MAAAAAGAVADGALIGLDWIRACLLDFICNWFYMYNQF